MKRSFSKDMVDQRLRDASHSSEQSPEDVDIRARSLRAEIQGGAEPIAVLRSEQRAEVLDRLHTMAVVTSEQLEKALAPELRLSHQHQARLYNLAFFGVTHLESQARQAELTQSSSDPPTFSELYQFMKPEHIEGKGIIGIDHQFYLPPSDEDIRAKLNAKTLKKIGEIPRPMLLLVPFGMDQSRLAKTITLQRGREGADHQQEARMPSVEGVSVGESSYFPNQILPGNGYSKESILAGETPYNTFPGWQVVVVSGEEDCDTSTAQVLGKSASDIRYKTAHGFLKDLQDQGFSGLTSEDWLTLHLLAMERGFPYETRDHCWLLGERKREFALFGHWDEYERRVEISFLGPQYGGGDYGIRKAVRIY